MRRLGESLTSRGYDVEVGSDGLILREQLPYELAEEDRGICGSSEVFEQRWVRASAERCCLDGHHCCEFEAVELEEQVAG